MKNQHCSFRFLAAARHNAQLAGGVFDIQKIRLPFVRMEEIRTPTRRLMTFSAQSVDYINIFPQTGFSVRQIFVWEKARNGLRVVS